MLSVPVPVRVFLCTAATDMRKSFNGLHGLVVDVLRQDPLSGDWFVFLNRRRDRIKILAWEQDGFLIWYKKLEQHYPHCFPFTGIGEVTDNRARRPTTGGGMDSSSARTGPRRRPMPREIAVIAPPRAQLSAGA